MKVNIGLMDIDNVIFPFGLRNIQYLHTQKKFPDWLVNDFLESGCGYTYDYMILKEKKQAKSIIYEFEKVYKRKAKGIKEKLELQRQNGLNNYTDDDLHIRSLFYASLGDYTHSPYFENGVNKDLQELNKKIFILGSDFQSIAITKRGSMLKESNPELYQKKIDITRRWRYTNRTYLNDIFFESNKIKALNDIQNKHSSWDTNFMYMIEDDPRTLEGFLEKGIPSILIKYESPYKYITKKLKDTYGSLLIEADSHKIAADIAWQIVIDTQNK